MYYLVNEPINVKIYLYTAFTVVRLRLMQKFLLPVFVDNGVELTSLTLI
jgi:hypothetical protein